MTDQPVATDDPVVHRQFARCVVCDLDIACWLGRNRWWHLDKTIRVDHDARPPSSPAATDGSTPPTTQDTEN